MNTISVIPKSLIVFDGARFANASTKNVVDPFDGNMMMRMALNGYTWDELTPITGVKNIMIIPYLSLLRAITVGRFHRNPCHLRTFLLAKSYCGHAATWTHPPAAPCSYWIISIPCVNGDMKQITYLCLVGNFREWSIITINNHAIPPFPSIPCV